MSTIDERGRTATAALRHEMTSQFDVETGLGDLLRHAPVVRSSEPHDPRRGWMLAAAAIVLVAVGAVGVLALRDDTSSVSDTPAVSTPASAPTVPATTSPSDSTAVPDEVTETTLVPDTAVSTTVLPVERTVRVADVVQVVEPQRTVLATAGFGGGAGELAIEDCQECDPARPWDPVQLIDGRLLVADPANGRWVVFESVLLAVPGDPPTTLTTEVDWPEGVTVSAQPVVDEAGLLFVKMYGSLGTGGFTAGELWVLDPSDLSVPLSRHPASGIFGSPPLLLPAAVVLDGSLVEGLGATLRSRPGVVASFDGRQVELRLDSATVPFVYPAGQSLVPYGPLPGLPGLPGPPGPPDGTGVVHVYESGREFVDRLYLDGRVARIELPVAASVFGAGWVDDRGFVRLELSDDGSTWDLAHYALPHADAFTSAGPVGERAAAIFADVAPELFVDGVVSAIASALGAEFRDDCADPVVADPQVSYEQEGDGSAIATFQLRIGCDDSGGGFRWVAELRFDGEAWRAVEVTEQTICSRGVTVSEGRELCV